MSDMSGSIGLEMLELEMLEKLKKLKKFRKPKKQSDAPNAPNVQADEEAWFIKMQEEPVGKRTHVYDRGDAMGPRGHLLGLIGHEPVPAWFWSRECACDAKRANRTYAEHQLRFCVKNGHTDVVRYILQNSTYTIK